MCIRDRQSSVPAGGSAWKKRLSARVRRVSRRTWVLVGMAGLVAVGAGVALSLTDGRLADEVLSSVGAKPTLASLLEKAKQNPKDAALQVELGHAQMEAGHRG